MWNSSCPQSQYVAGAVLCLFVMGCVNTRALDPAADPISLDENEGILVVHIRTQVKLASIRVAGASPQEIATDLPAGEHLIFLAAAKGQYSWQRIVRKIPPSTYYWNLRDRHGEWNFTVEPGRINYPGVFEIGGSEPRISLRLRTFNRSAMALADLKRRYPAMVERFPMRYAGSRRDDFLDYYLEASQALRPLEVPGQ